MIKAVIFDLDDTLLDTTGQVIVKGHVKALKEMVKLGLPISFDEAVKLMEKLKKEKGEDIKALHKVCSELKFDNEEVLNIGLDIYHNYWDDDVKLFPDTIPTLEELKQKGLKLVLVSHGRKERQNMKIDVLGIRQYFDFVFIDGNNEKGKYFSEAMEKLNLNPDEIIVVGDKITAEIKEANSLGITTVRMLHGRRSKLKPADKLETADYEIKNIKEVLELI
ncbi:HAD-IA family hydrolase [Candidatus Woesearchaeota archaeon]|nr:HAD-IA family hydrolase [Candidatus Woesearchaeota archaeon]